MQRLMRRLQTFMLPRWLVKPSQNSQIERTQGQSKHEWSEPISSLFVLI